MKTWQFVLIMIALCLTLLLAASGAFMTRRIRGWVLQQPGGGVA